MIGRRIHHVILDMDGTMLDSRQQCYFAIKQTLQHFGVGGNFCQDDCRDIWGVGIEEFWRSAGIPEYVPFKEIDDQFWDIFPTFPHTTPFEGTEQALKNLSNIGVVLSLLSAARESDVHAFLDIPVDDKDSTMYEVFTYVHPRCVVEKKQAISDVITRLGANPETTAYVEDSPSAIQAANELGLLTIGMIEGYASPERIKDANPDHCVKTPLELVEIVKKNYL